MKFLLLLISILVTTSQSLADDYKDLAKSQLEIFRDKENTPYLGLFFENKEKWHTYWKNPGDAGLPFKHKFKLDGKEIKLLSLEWPAPKRFIEEGNLWAYGYEKLYGFFFHLPNNSLIEWEGKELTVQSKWLICKDICIPGKQTLQGTIRQGKFVSQRPQQLNLNLIQQQKIFDRLPYKSQIPRELSLKLYKEGDKNLFLLYSYPQKRELSSKVNFFTPFPSDLISYGHEELYFDEEAKLIVGKMPVTWDGAYSVPPVPFPKNLEFSSPLELSFLFQQSQDQVRKILTFKLDKVLPWPFNNTNDYFKKYPEFTNSLLNTTSGHSSQKVASSLPSQNSLIVYLFLAFLGGLILNVMPCVLPIISLKLFGLIKQKGQTPKEILKYNLFYAAGIYLSFLLLGTALILLKGGGEALGWGFHLQSSAFVSTMIVFLFIFSLNLFGLFEFSTPGGKFFGNLSPGEGNAGAFTSGILATILSTPCSAPFLGTALSFAFTSPPLTILLTFLFVGIGLSFPFLIIGIYPKALNLLPKSGPWMDHLKKFLGLALLLTILWLFDVFMDLSSGDHFYLNLLLIFVFFGFYFNKTISKNFLFKIIFSLSAVLLFIKMQFGFSEQKPMNDSNSTQVVAQSSFQRQGEWIPWSPQKLEILAAERKYVFMDFTAKWCFTCKINKKLVLDTTDFYNLAKKYKITLLVADWTKRDKVIGKWLEARNVVGVPAYFIQTPEGKTIPLGETITITKIEDVLKN